MVVISNAVKTLSTLSQDDLPAPNLSHLAHHNFLITFNEAVAATSLPPFVKE